MQNYVNAKFRILQNLTSQDAFIFWQDDPIIEAQLRQIETQARLYPFAETIEENTQAYIDAEKTFDKGQTVNIGLKKRGVFVFDKETGERLA
jgi:UDP-N-acetylmuramoylalanine--D-glutamate ligase